MHHIQIQSQSRPANDFIRIVDTSLEFVRRSSEDWEKRHHCSVGVVFAAFTAEAMINHYGKVLFGSRWAEVSAPNGKHLDRKDLHKTVFRKANFPKDYRGNKTYQTINSCLKIRDKFAHGKLEDEELYVDSETVKTSSDIILHPSSIIGDRSEEELKALADALYQLQEDFETYAEYPGQEHLPEEERERICQRPLDVTGVKTWNASDIPRSKS